MRMLAAALVSFISVSAPAEDKIQGSVSADKQTVTLRHGLAAIDKKGSISVRLLGAAPNAREEARALEESGAARADLASFKSCHVGFHEFKAGRFDWTGFSKQCGVTELSGDLKPGSVVHGKLQGRVDGYPPPSGAPPAYTWDVDFTARVMRLDWHAALASLTLRNRCRDRFGGGRARLDATRSARG